MEKVNIEEKLALFDEQWKPKIVGELFLVVKGRFRNGRTVAELDSI